MDPIGKASGWRCQSTGKAELQPLFGDCPVGTVGSANFYTQIPIEEIPGLLSGNMPAAVCRGGQGKKRRIYGNEGGFRRWRNQWNVGPVRFATRAYERCNDAFFIRNCFVHALGKKSVARPCHRHTIGVIRGCTAGLNVCKTYVLTIARTAGEFGRIVTEQYANLSLVVKTRLPHG